MTSTDGRPGFHLAIPVDDLGRARSFYGGVLGLPEGRSAERWVDWDFHGHQLVTHLVPARAVGGSADDGGTGDGGTDAAGGPGGVDHNPVDGHDVPVPHFGVILPVPAFHELAARLRAAGTRFVIEPYQRFAGEPGEQWTMFLLDPAGNALEFKAFADESQIFAR
ncbi:MAG: VOC family protein [Actinocatenispora sp.]